MVLQVLAHGGQVGHDGDAERPQFVGRAHAGLHQDLGRANGAGREHHLAGGADAEHLAADGDLHARATAAVEEEALHLGEGDHRQVGPGHGRVEQAVGDAVALADDDAEIEATDALHLRAVVIGGRGHPRLLGRLDERAGERVGIDGLGHAQRPARAAVVVGAAGVVFEILEDAADRREVPAGVALVGPVLVIEAVAAHPDAGVDAGRAPSTLPRG